MQHQKSVETAKEFLNTNVKVESIAIEEMKGEMEEIIRENGGK